MKVLSLSLDRTIMRAGSAASRRAATYGSLVDGYSILAPAKTDACITLSNNVSVCGVASSSRAGLLYAFYKKAKQALKSNQYDVIIVQDPYYLGFVGVMLANHFHAGLEVQVHGLEKFFGLRTLLAGYVLSKADSIRVVSKRLERKLIDTFRAESEKITVVPIYTEPVQHAFQDKKNSTFIFLTVGRLVPVKNIGLQIKAFSKIVKEYPHTELWIVGAGSEQEKLQAASASAREKIKFFGNQQELGSFYNRADAFLLTSNYEGWGLVAIEAAYHHVPIIMTDVGCAGEVIQDGISGIVIPVKNEKELLRAMDHMISGPELRTSLSNAAYKAVQRLPNKEQTFALYRESWNRCHQKSI